VTIKRNVRHKRWPSTKHAVIARTLLSHDSHRLRLPQKEVWPSGRNDILHQQQQIFCSERTVFFDVV
jgi:hypothetical protein